MFQKTLTGGRYNESNYPVQELWRKRGGGRIFEGGVLAGHYGSGGGEGKYYWRRHKHGEEWRSRGIRYGMKKKWNKREKIIDYLSLSQYTKLKQ